MLEKGLSKAKCLTTILSTEEVCLMHKIFNLSLKILRLSLIISHLIMFAYSQLTNLVCSIWERLEQSFIVRYLHSDLTVSLSIFIKPTFLKHILSAQADKPFRYKPTMFPFQSFQYFSFFCLNILKQKVVLLWLISSITK